MRGSSAARSSSAARVARDLDQAELPMRVALGEHRLDGLGQHRGVGVVHGGDDADRGLPGQRVEGAGDERRVLDPPQAIALVGVQHRLHLAADLAPHDLAWHEPPLEIVDAAIERGQGGRGRTRDATRRHGRLVISAVTSGVT
jgi:hypothetical protein